MLATTTAHEVSQSITDALVLSRIFSKRQKRYRGVSTPPFLDAAEQIMLPNGTNVTVQQAALAMELMLSPIGTQNRAPWGEGSTWFGVDTLIDPVDAAVFSALLFEGQPDLIIEIGTECGGSAVFFATMMAIYSRTARVLTYDVKPLWKRCARHTGPAAGGRKTSKGYRSDLWKRHVQEGRIIPRIADVASLAEQSAVRQYVANASRVWVVDDGDHFTTPLLVHFHLLARHVSPGGFYLIADTRLEQTCAAHKHFMGGHIPWGYCRNLLGPLGGPSRAVTYLQHESAFFRDHFAVDRSAERWIFTQHPGGWLRRHSTQPRTGVLRTR